MKKLLIVIFIIAFPLSHPYAQNGPADFSISEAKTTFKVLNFIGEYYIDQSRIDPQGMLKGTLNQIQKNAAEILVTFDSDDKFTVTIDKAVKKFSYNSLDNISKLLDALKDVYTFIEIHYHGSIKLEDIEYLAIEGFLSVLDPHSNILTPKIFNEFKIGTKGKFGGIGIVIGSKDGELTVISPIEGTPAWNAGIKAKDKIIQIGEESTINMTLTEAVELLRGDVGTEVVITIDRSGRANPFNVALKRAVINIDSVQSSALNLDNKTIGYIKIKNFQEDTDKEFSKQLAKIKNEQNFSGLVLDLRNNPGGLLSQAVSITDKFLSEGVIVSTIGAGKKSIEEETAVAADTEALYPLVVLVNEGSASASEIVAGTLQSYKRALVVGSQSFGKGSVQTIYDLRDGSALKLTIAEYLTAGKNSIQSKGVTPDIKLIPATVDKEKMDIIEDEHESENSLEGHLARSEISADKDSLYKVNFLQPPETENDEELNRREYSKKLDFSKDFAVQFAGRVIASIPLSAPKDFITNAVPVITKSSKEQEAAVSVELGKLGIDWSDCNTTSKPLLEVSFSLEKNGQIVKQVSAGDNVSLVLNAKNIGTGDFCRLVGFTDSQESALKNKEFILGWIAPHAIKKWSIPFKVPNHLVSQNLPVKVKFHEANAHLPLPFEAIVPIKGLEPPQFAYTFKLGEPVGVKVQKNPMPQGKTIPLIFEIKNIGGGISSNAVAIIKNADQKGIFIDNGRFKIGKLEPGQAKTVVFKFHTEPSLAKTTFELEFTVLDQDLFTGLTKKIEFDTATGAANPPSSRWYEGPKISSKSKNLPLKTAGQKQHIEVDLSDDQQIKDYFIFVGEDKVSYYSNPLQTEKYKISTDIPLKNGNNIVSIAARDNLDIVTRYNFVIEKK